MPSTRTATFVFLLALVGIVGVIAFVLTGNAVPDFFQSLLTLLVGASAGLAVPRNGV